MNKGKNKIRVPVSSKITEDHQTLWKTYAIKKRLKLHEALEELIELGSKTIKLAARS